MRHIAVFCATGLGVVLAACGSLDSNTGSAPTLATLQGSLALANPDSLGASSSSDVRIAVVWRGDTPGKFSVTEDLPVQPVFPSSFTIELDGPPPEAAMTTVTPPVRTPPAPLLTDAAAGPAPVTAAAGGPPPDARVDEAGAANSQAVMLLDTPAPKDGVWGYAVGTVVAYLDQNHNGKLDLVPDTATKYVDRILAANQELTIEYFEGQMPIRVTDTFGHSYKDGYNLLKIPACDVADSPIRSACPWVQPVGPACLPEILGMDTPYPLTIDSSPAVASLMCLVSDPAGPIVGTETDAGSVAGMAGTNPSSTTGNGGPFDPSVQPAQYPLPGDPDLCCDPDGSQYFYLTCMEVSQGLCKGIEENCTAMGYARPTPAPSTWPCPAQ